MLPCLIVVPPVWGAARWYLRRATAGYLRENASWGVLTDSLAETVDGARTVEALRLGPARRDRTDADIAACWAAERYTLRLRTFFLPAAEASYILPLAGVLAFGGFAYLRGWCTLGQVTAGALYARALVAPMDELITWLDYLQIGAASLARLLGLAQVPPDRQAGSARPADDQLRVTEVTHGYVPGHDVLRRISLAVEPGERIAIVGPSGAGKSTLGRLLAGITGPDRGEVAVGGVPLVELPLDELRGQIALVTQEHHIFAGTLRDNLTLGMPDASDQAVLAALTAVDALGWAQELGLSSQVGSGGAALSAPQAQQVALARLILADPHTLVLDEATSLLDPRSARRLEQSLSAVLEGRTVLAIAHRLHTAHDADRVIVMEDGQITESGTHRELIAAGGPYAALWNSWHGEGRGGPARRAGRARRGCARRCGQGEFIRWLRWISATRPVDIQNNLAFTCRTPCAISGAGSRNHSPPKRATPRGDPGNAGESRATGDFRRCPKSGGCGAAHRPPSHRLASAPSRARPLHLIRGGASALSCRIRAAIVPVRCPWASRAGPDAAAPAERVCVRSDSPAAIFRQLARPSITLLICLPQKYRLTMLAGINSADHRIVSSGKPVAPRVCRASQRLRCDTDRDGPRMAS